MAKRGETYPYRVLFQWENGVKGTGVLGTEEEARYLIEKMTRTAHARELSLAWTLELREGKDVRRIDEGRVVPD